MEGEVDVTKVKYVLYARKSTDDAGRQPKSIPDQISECKALAKRLGLHIINPVLTETKSAKIPGKRPIFKEMIKDLKKGRYNGVLAWNPDRLARNMLEGGEIINMVDEGQIEDLKFVSHHFTKDANGKMLLGMAFVLSKQYSDKLSQDVTRGVHSNLQKGKSPTPKHGYIRNEGGLYQPDGKNFELICAAWEMRSQGKSLRIISEFMNDNGYNRVVKTTGRRIDMDMRILTDIFKDPFYYGLLVQANQKVNLRDIYQFQPAITEQTYNQIQQFTGKRQTPLNLKRRLSFYPLKGIVTCSSCGHNMVVGPSTARSGKRFLYYRCDNVLCSRKKKSIRAKEIFHFIYDFLKEGLNLTEKDYDEYYKDLTRISDKSSEKTNIEIHSKEGSLKHILQEIKSISLQMGKADMLPTVKKINEARINELEIERIHIEETIEKLRTKVTKPEDDKLNIEQFLNLSKDASRIIQSANAVTKDVISREIFLNLSVDEEKVLSYQLRPHFEHMIKIHNLRSSRDGRT